jgi:hypothetical protein
MTLGNMRVLFIAAFAVVLTAALCGRQSGRNIRSFGYQSRKRSIVFWKSNCSAHQRYVRGVK